ncbi:Uncharacterised protein [Nocardia farcinica]|uniref:Uncharacterized protein n=1 Tax=Nocardia farcinica TaxID=37329 RepID=A0A449GK29_NOCFR|nr:hypothetical protein [Nocardia farcinica]VFA92979.1 Uncharacterised protein [Nocardia farcinica]
MVLPCPEAGAWWLRADVLSDMARQAIYLDRADDALTLLGAAKVREDRISPLRRANLSAVQARAFGALGDVWETLRAVRDADEYFHEATTDTGGEPDPDNFGDYFAFAQLNGDTAHGLYGIARAGHAVEETRHRLRVAAENYGPEWARSRAFCLALDAKLGPALRRARGRHTAWIGSHRRCRRDRVGAFGRQHPRDPRRGRRPQRPLGPTAPAASGSTAGHLTKGPAVLYAHADDPRAAADALRERLRRSVFRERAVRSGAEETYITVLDPIDRTVTIKIRRVLSTGAVA